MAREDRHNSVGLHNHTAQLTRVQLVRECLALETLLARFMMTRCPELSGPHPWPGGQAWDAREMVMNRRAGVVAAGFGLALLIAMGGATLGRSGDDDEEEMKATQEAQQAIVQMMDAMRKGDDGKKQAEAIHTKFPDLKPVMNIFKPSKKGGLGVGTKGQGDGIEQRLISWSKKSNPDLAQNRAAMQRAAEVSRAMSEVTELYLPKKDVEKWKQYCDEMRQGADELLKAVRTNNAVAVKSAVTNLNGSCTNCHGVFRDN